MIDTHCHLYVKEFDADREQVIKRALESGVTRFYLPAIDQQSHEAMIKLEENYPDNCFALIGLHPCSVQKDYQHELAIISDLLEARTFAGIGETGLDLYWDKTYFEEQKVALKKQIEWALAYDLPLILHTREATSETIDVVAEYKGRGLRGIFHCFGGTREEADAIIALGFHLGIGGVLTYKNAGLDKVLSEIDLAHLVLETDAPYLSPVPHRGKRNESSYLGLVAEKLAQVKGCTLSEVIQVTNENAGFLFEKRKN